MRYRENGSQSISGQGGNVIKNTGKISKRDIMNIKSLDLLLVNPSFDWESERIQRMTMRIEKDRPNQEAPLLNIAYLIAAAKKANLRVKFIDMVVDGFGTGELLEFISKTKPPLIGFTAFTKQICDVGKVSEQIKHKIPNAIICVGGCHASAIPKQTLEEFAGIDFVFCGEAEEQLPKIFDYLKNPGALAKLHGVVTRETNVFQPGIIENLDEIPFPAWEEFDLTKYPGNVSHRTELPIITSRGCPFSCTFCCRSSGEKVRYRSVNLVISEIERNIEKFGCETVHFYDENFLLDKKRTRQLFFELNNSGLNKKIKWTCSMRVDKVTPELVVNMKKAGCYRIFFGFESANNNTLKIIKKGTNVSQMLQAVRITKQAGIVPTGAFMIGLPGDTEEDVYKAIELGKELDLYSITFPILVPYPGTEIREQALKNMYGMRIISNNWEYYGRKSIDSKEDFEILESADLSAKKRRELQIVAYSKHPKKNMEEYLRRSLRT